MAVESITLSTGDMNATIRAEDVHPDALTQAETADVIHRTLTGRGLDDPPQAQGPARDGDLVPGLIAARVAKVSVNDFFPAPSLEEFLLPDQNPGPDEDLAYRDFIDGHRIALIASELIGQAGRQFRHLAEARIQYRWKREGGRSGGADTIGKPMKLSGLLRDELDADFLIWLAADHCRLMRAREVERAIFHLLCHFALSDDKEPTIKIVRHDFEGFGPELKLYGLRGDFRVIGRALQLELPDLWS